MKKRSLAMLIGLLCASVFAAEPQPPGWLGLGFDYRLASTPRAANFIVVKAIAPGGPAEEAGIHVQDLISAIGGKPLRFRDIHEALRFFASLKPGDTVTFTVVHGGKARAVKVTARTMPPEYVERWRSNAERAKQWRGDR